MKKDNFFLGILVVLLLLLLFFGSSMSWWLQGVIRGSHEESHDSLALENQSLKSELAQLQDVKNELPQLAPRFVRAMVYSRYPFTIKNELLINAGKDQGLLPGEAVVFRGASEDVHPSTLQSFVLLGQVEKVYQSTALVETLFDERWRSAVRIGSTGAESLLVGGAEPRLTLISKHAEIASGAPIYSAAPSFPYGLPVGTVNHLELSSDQVSQEGTVVFPYDMNAIHTVFVITNYAPSSP